MGYKFRIWDKLDKCFWYFELQDLLKCKSNLIENCNQKIVNSEISMYTGVNDKGGKEIYEGDVILNKFDKGTSGIVTYGLYDGHLGFYVNWKRGLHTDLLKKNLAFWASVSVVIENIFENPEIADG
jgi:hypothetical protein